MSKTNIKAKGDKGGKGSNIPTPAVTHEIVPGKFNDQDWFTMLEKDSGDEFVVDLIDDMITSVLDHIFQKNIEKQLIPYTVLKAKEEMLDIVQWQFLIMDQGEKSLNEDIGWIPEEEPCRMLTDNWAQGSIPQIQRNNTFTVESNIDEQEDDDNKSICLEDGSQVKESMNQDGDCLTTREITKSTEFEDDANDNNNNTTCNNNIVDVSTCDKISLPGNDDDSPPIIELSRSNTPIIVKPPTKKKKKFKPYKGVLKNDSLMSITTPLDKSDNASHVSPLPQHKDQMYCAMPLSCQSLVRLQNGRPPGHRDVEFDKFGNVISMAKVDLSSNPNRKVNLQFQIIDPLLESSNKNKVINKSRNEKLNNKSQPLRKTDANEIMKSIQPKIKTKPVTCHIPGPMFDQMDAMSGVVIVQGDRVKAGPRDRIRKHPATSKLSTELKPLQLKSLISEEYTVDDIVNRTGSVINDCVINTLPTVPPIQNNVI